MTDHSPMWGQNSHETPARIINIRKGDMVRLPNGFVFRAVEDSRYYAEDNSDTVRGRRWIISRNDWSRQTCIFSCKNYTILS